MYTSRKLIHSVVKNKLLSIRPKLIFLHWYAPSPSSLRWNDFEANVSRSFAGIRDHSQFFDCTLTTDDDEAYSDNLRAHKVILSACSEFFRNILTKESMSAHPNPLIYLR